MKIPDLKFIVKNITAQRETKNGKKYRMLYLHRSAPRGIDDEKMGEDDDFECYVPESKFPELDGVVKGTKVTASLYFNGRVKQYADKDMHVVNVNLAKISDKD
jgi:hypothetical protein